jgi:hypothetical protein
MKTVRCAYCGCQWDEATGERVSPDLGNVIGAVVCSDCRQRSNLEAMARTASAQASWRAETELRRLTEGCAQEEGRSPWSPEA